MRWKRKALIYRHLVKQTVRRVGGAAVTDGRTHSTKLLKDSEAHRPNFCHNLEVTGGWNSGLVRK